MKLYIISGVTGMTGNELARQILSKKSGRVIGFDNFYCSGIEIVKDCLKDPSFRFFEYDLNDSGQMKQLKTLILAERLEYDEVIYVNCAAVVHTEHFYHVNETFETNVLGMKAFLNQAIEIGATSFINCSTSEVYSMNSWNESGGVTEKDYILLANAEHSQRTSYAVGKLQTEFFIRDAVNKGKIKGCSIRFANVYSKNELLPKHIIPHIFNELENDKEVVLLENSKVNRRTFLHNIDSCLAVLALAAHSLALDGSIYNVATEEEVTIVELVKQCAAKLGIADPKIRFEGYRESDPQRRLLSVKKIRKITDWKPNISLDEGLSMCAEWRKGIKENGE